MYGERRVFSLGVAGFGAASLLCAIAPTIETLVAARALQGIFGALLTPSALALIVMAFTPSERGGAIGSWTAWAGIATVVGPFIGGGLLGLAGIVNPRGRVAAEGPGGQIVGVPQDVGTCWEAGESEPVVAALTGTRG